MNRRQFIQRTTAGFIATAIVPGFWSCSTPRPIEKVCGFCNFRRGKTFGDVTCVTPEDGFYVHTFYDVCPFSPSQRYLAVTKFPYQGKKPRLGDIADVCVIDLEERTIKTVYSTRAWSFQLGANVQWSNTCDRILYANDWIEDKAVCVRIDLDTNEVTAFSGPKYDLAADDSFVVGGKLEYTNAVQYGYGIPDGPSNEPNYMSPGDIYHEGIWKTDLKTSDTRLLVSFAHMAEHLTDRNYYNDGTFYCFHTKVNKSNSRIMQVLRCRLPGNKGGRNSSLFTVDTEGRDVIEAMSRATWSMSGKRTGAANHPNWHPDGEHIVMNVVPKSLGYDEMRFCMFRYDGSDLQVLSQKHLGSGHPSVDATGRYLISDAYPKQTWAIMDNGEVPIRLIDLDEDEEQTVCSVSVDVGGSRGSEKGGGSHFKLDPHPAWSRDYKKICFNGAVNAVRRVFIADLSEVI